MKKIKHKLQVLLLLIGWVYFAGAQNLDFISLFKYSQSANSVVLTPYVQDAAGNYYMGVYLYSVVADTFDLGLGGTPYLYPSQAGVYPSFLIKYDSHFNLKWINTLSAPVGRVAAIDQLALSDNDASVIAVGTFAGTATLYRDTLLVNSYKQLTSQGSNDVMIIKCDTIGDYIFAESFGGTGNESANKIAVTSAGDLLITGTFDTVCNFDPQGNTAVVTGGDGSNGYNVFIAWYNPADGSFTKVEHWDNYYFFINSLALTNSHDILLAGYFSGVMNADPTGGTTTVTNVGGNDCILIRLQADGSFKFATQIGGAGNESFGTVKASGTSTYLSGSFSSATMDFDPGNGTATGTCMGGADAFFMALDDTGGFQFVKTFGGAGNEAVSDMAVNVNGVFLVGSFSSILYFNQGMTPTTLYPFVQGDAFLLQYDLSGNFISGGATASQTSSTSMFKLWVDPTGNYATVYGSGHGNVNVGMNKQVMINLPYNFDNYIAIYDFLAVPPDTAAANISFSNVTDSSMTVSFTKGSGSKRLVVARIGAPVNQLPANSTFYTASSTFGLGQDIGGGNYSVYIDSGNYVNLTGLLPSTTYYFSVFEFNGQSSKINFLTTGYPTGSQQTKAGAYRWVDSVIAYSSEFGNASWSANQVKGLPDVYPIYNENKLAWAPATPDAQREWLTVHFAGTPQVIRQINIYETYNPGAVDSVFALDPAGQWELLWSGDADTTLPAKARVNTINFAPTAFPVSVVRISLNSPLVQGWNEIDAINILDTATSTAISAASSDIMEVNVYPNPSHEAFTTQFELTEVANVEITASDMNGRVICKTDYLMMNAGMQLLQTNTSNWPDGLYVMQLRVNGEVATRKISVIK